MNRERVVFFGLIPALMLIVFIQLVPNTARVDALRGRYYGGAGNFMLASRSDSLRVERLRFTTAFKRADARERADAALARNRGGLYIESTPLVTAKDVESVRSVVLDELKAIGVETPRHPINILVLKDTTLRFPRYERAVVLPRDAAAPCTIVIRIANRFGFQGTARSDRLLGTCAFHAQYGMPGAGVQGWLVESGLRLASYRTAPPSQQPEEGGRLGPNASNIALSYSGVAGCRRGRADACAQLFRWQSQTQTWFWWEEVFRLPAGIVEPGVVLAPPSMFTGASAIATHGMLAAMADSLSAERFERIWTSADRPEVAFEATAGEPLAAWMTRFLQHLIPVFRSGPSLALFQWVFAVAMIVLLFVLVTRRAQRQMT